MSFTRVNLEEFFMISLVYCFVLKMMSVVVDNLFSDDRQKKLLIIRGLPGTGKSHLKVNKLMRDGFFILDMDTFIQTDKNSVREAQMIIANKMLKCFQRQYKKVCITGIFSKKILSEFFQNGLYTLKGVPSRFFTS